MKFVTALFIGGVSILLGIIAYQAGYTALFIPTNPWYSLFCAFISFTCGLTAFVFPLTAATFWHLL